MRRINPGAAAAKEIDVALDLSQLLIKGGQHQSPLLQHTLADMPAL